MTASPRRTPGRLRQAASLAGLLLFALACHAAAISPPPPPPPPTKTGPGGPSSKAAAAKRIVKTTDPAKAISWAASLSEGLAAAKKSGQPVLVRVWGQSCPWCKKLDAELAKRPLERELSRWTLVAVDADKAHDDARQLGVGPIPALRVLTARGRAVASHDGYLPADKLLTWLDEAYLKAAGAPDEILAAEGDPSPADVERLVAQFAQREPAQREAAIRRLLRHPAIAAPSVVKSLRGEPLGPAGRLGAAARVEGAAQGTRSLAA